MKFIIVALFIITVCSLALGQNTTCTSDVNGTVVEKLIHVYPANLIASCTSGGLCTVSSNDPSLSYQIEISSPTESGVYLLIDVTKIQFDSVSVGSDFMYDTTGRNIGSCLSAPTNTVYGDSPYIFGGISDDDDEESPQ
jgi:hypothetical protein